MARKELSLNTAQRIVKNTFSLLFSGIISQAIGFVVIVYLARVLNPDNFGKISFALAIITYFSLITNLGLPLLGTREIARDKKKIGEYLGNILTMRLCLAFLSFGLLLLITYFLNKPLEIKYLIILYGLGLIPSALLLDWVFQGLEKMEYIGLGRILSRLIYAVLVLSFIKGQKQLLLIPCIAVASNLLVTGFLFFIFIKNFGKLKLKFNIIFWKNLVHQALPLGISIIMIQIIYNIDMVMLGFMRTDIEVGYYSAAYKIILVLISIGAFYFDAIFPVISNYYKTSLDSLKKLQSYTAKLIVSIVIPLGVGGTILARPIMNLLYGPKYSEGIIVFQILIWVMALICINSIYARGMWACNKQNEFLKIVFFQGLSNIGLNLFLIPSFGIVGAAIATVLAEILGFFFYYREFNKTVSVPIYHYIVRPLLASIIMALFLQWGLNVLNLSVFLLIFAGTIIYFVFLFLMKGISNEEIELIRSNIMVNKR